MNKSATLKYVLKPGFTHYHREPDGDAGLHGDVVKLKAGAVVDLTAKQAENFSDRFELLTAVQARAEAEIAMAKAATTQAEEQKAAAPVEAPAEPAAEATAETAAAAFDPVDVEARGAKDLIAIVEGLETEAQVRQVADDEVSRGTRKRSTVLAAADARLEELDA